MKIVKLGSTVSVSVTGTACSLNCKHCGRHYLESMIPINKMGIIPESTKSLLISGGSTIEGKVPVIEHLDEIKKLKKFKLNFHTGLVSEDEAREISEVADAVSFDFVGNDDVIKDVYNLNAKVSDYVESLENLLKFKKEIYPHITVGLDCGKITHEYKAIDILSSYDLEKVVFLVLIPTPSTYFENCNPPDIDEIKKVFKYAREKLTCELNLGCMYPKGKLRDEIALAAIEADFNVVVQPSERIVNLLLEKGFKLTFQDECCIF